MTKDQPLPLPPAQHTLANSTQVRGQEDIMRLLTEDERVWGKEGELALSHLSVGTCV